MFPKFPQPGTPPPALLDSFCPGHQRGHRRPDAAAVCEAAVHGELAPGTAQRRWMGDFWGENPGEMGDSWEIL